MIAPLLLALASPVAATVPPPPIVKDAGPAERRIDAWLPGEARCDGVAVVPVVLRRPLTALGWGSESNARPLTYGFTIDESGRPLSIHRLSASGYTPYSTDIAPSLAATRFAPGGARGACTITYTLRQTTLGETPLADLVSYTLAPDNGALPEAGWARIRAGGTCTDRPRPEPLLQAFPDYRALPATPGVRDWTLIGYDLTAKGRPIAAHVVTSTGNAALNDAALRAIVASRYTDGTPRVGCVQPYWRAPATLPPPPLPEEEAYRPAGATCPSHHDWARYPTLTYPDAYRRRSIEGWAMVTYDVAPWGEVGNVKVVRAEPTEDFGTQAIGVIRSASVPTTAGLVGCVDRVRFRMPGSNEPLPREGYR